MSQDITEDDELRGVVARVEKLMRLAAKNPNENEAAQATAKAMELLAAYNLSMEDVAEHGEDSGGVRKQEALEGGQHDWEQALWRAVAELNFCMYWHQSRFVVTPLGRFQEWRNGRFVKGLYRHQHNIVGKKVNIAATNAMASYLQAAIERLTRERCVPAKIGLHTRWATSFREGLTFGVVGKLHDRRADLLSEERKKQREAEERAMQAATDGASTSTAITLSSYSKEEHEKNFDFRFGEGAYAEQMAERARRAEAKRKADEEYTRWAAENPKEAAKEEKRRQRERDRIERDFEKSRRYTGNEGAWLDGNSRSDQISLDPQAGHANNGRKRLK